MRNEKGQALVITTLFLGILFGMTTLAVDVGNLYFIRASLQRAADAAVLAGATGLTLSEAEATVRATAIANQNLSTQPSLSGSTSSASFPTAGRIRVTVRHPAVTLFFGGLLGIPTASVSTSAAATLNPVSSVTGDLVPLAVYCNNPATGCDGVLAVGQTRTVRRYCGNFFVGGSEGSVCGNAIAPGEVFLQGVTLTRDSESNAEFRSQVYSGYPGTVRIGEAVGALPGNRNGWQDGMTGRLAEGRNEMILAVIRPNQGEPTPADHHPFDHHADDNSVGNALTMEIHDFLKVRVHQFAPAGNTDSLTFEIIQGVTSSGSPALPGQGLGINSVVKVQLVE